MNLNSRYHLFLTFSFYVKLAQKQINDEIWQLGLFFIIKEYGNKTFLRLFVCQYFHENLVLFPAQIIKSGDDDFNLSTIENHQRGCWTHLSFYEEKNLPGLQLRPFVCKFPLFELLGKFYWFIEEETANVKFTLNQNARFWVSNDHFDDYGAVWYAIMWKKTQRSLFKQSFLSCSQTDGDLAFYDGRFSWDIFYTFLTVVSVFAFSFFSLINA